jgi:membrane protein
VSANTTRPARWREIASQTVRDIGRDDCMGLSAQLAFYFFLAVFPALLFLVALIGNLPIGGIIDQLMETLRPLAPGEVLTVVRRQIDDVIANSSGGLLTAGIAGALWSSSAAMVAIISALNRAYEITEWRPWWKRRALAVGLTLALAGFIILSMTLVLIGPDVATWLADWLGLGAAVAIVWSIVRWPVMVALMAIGLNLIYHFAPNRKRRWAWMTPGSLLATGLWLLSSFGFKFYVTNFANYNATYGAIGGIIVMLMWFYASALAILVGAELDAVLERLARDAHTPSAPSAV